MRRIGLISQNKADIESILSEAFPAEDRYFKVIECGDCKITVFIAEEYYFRINSDLTLTVIAEETADETTVEIISGGGKEGLLGFSYGAEKSAERRIVNLFKENGFTEQ